MIARLQAKSLVRRASCRLPRTPFQASIRVRDRVIETGPGPLQCSGVVAGSVAAESVARSRGYAPSATPLQQIAHLTYACTHAHARMRKPAFHCSGVAPSYHPLEKKEEKAATEAATSPLQRALSVAGKAQPIDIIEKGGF